MNIDHLQEQLIAIRKAAIVLAKINNNVIKKIEKIQEKLEKDHPDVPGSLEIIKEKFEA